MIKVSIILTTYNLKEIISNTLISLIGQEFYNYEIIIVDDGSTDGTYEKVKKFDDRFDIVKSFKIPHQGVGYARNYGFEKSKGEYVIFLDGDDLFKPDLIYKMYENIYTEKSDICVCNSYEFKDNPKYPTKKHYNNDYYPVGWAWDKIIKRKLIEDNHLKFSTLSSSNDLSFVYTLFFLAKSITKIEDFLVARRIRKNSISNNRVNENGFLALVELKNNMEKLNIYEKFENDFKNIALRFLYWYFNSSKDKESKKEIYDLIKQYENEFNILGLEEIKYPKFMNFYRTLISSANVKTFSVKYLINKITSYKKYD